jgi:hypothetical protein
LFSPVIPMENDGQAKSVSHRCPAFWVGTLGHRKARVWPF